MSCNIVGNPIDLHAYGCGAEMYVVHLEKGMFGNGETDGGGVGLVCSG